MTDTPPSDGPSQGAEFDMMGALDWKDGIATLPGSDIRFRMTEFGTLEIVTDSEVKGQEAEPNSETLDPAPSHSPTPPPEGQSDTGTATAPANHSQPGSSQGKLARCRACGGHVPRDTLLQGKFCSSICAQPSSGSLFTNLLVILFPPVSPVTAPPTKKRTWSWPAYLEEERAIAAPVKLFKEHQSFPQSRNGFKVGMKLEGLDPCHPSLFCVLTVAEIQGYRVRLHFDGYPECYDFWVNADTWDVKPAGWCEKMGHKLLLPKGCKEGEFNWSMYVKNCRGQLAPKHLFKSLNTSVTPSGFRAGMKLEAVDRKNPSLICVATIAAVVDNRLLIHFDNWDDTYDYWCDASSPYIHPVGFCEDNELTLTTPAGKHPKSFAWEKYLEETGTQAAPARAFKPRPPHGFHVGMKLEAVDKRNPMLIRVATIADTEDHRLKIHFDGWSKEYDYWVDTDCPDLHPVGWCQKTGHPLQHPNGSTDLASAPGQGCPTPGCNGVGHIRGPRYGTHYTCPYSEMNLNKEGLLPDRLSGERPLTLSGPHPRGRRPDPHAITPTQTPTTPEQPEGPSVPFPPLCNSVCSLSLSPASPDSISLQQALHESVFSPGISSSPPHRVALCWDKHCQLLPEVLGLTAKRVATWSAEEVATFVKGLPGCKEHAATFRTEQIDGEAFLLLTQADIVKILSIKLGPALKIYNSILMLKNADEE
uniref:L3MBTL histone methyl-lysine binding protein 1b n=1 Tax=Myripristis murdjan TaxID=586833 RepID=A0A667XG75_9TELE